MCPRKRKGSKLAEPKKAKSRPDDRLRRAAVTAPTPHRSVHDDNTVSQVSRRIAWSVYFIEALGSPDRSEWNARGGTVCHIMQQFNVPTGSRASVLKVLNDVAVCQLSGTQYDGRGAVHGGHNKLIQLNSLECQIIADCVELGMSITGAMCMTNEYRSSVDQGHVGRSAVYSAVQRLNPVVTPLRRQKQGNPDQDSAWAIARRGMAEQLARRLGIWEWDNVCGPRPSYLDQSRLSALELSQIVVWDETHKETQVGEFGANGRRQQVRFARDEYGKLDANGAIGPEKTYLNMKFAQEARFSLGCAIVSLDDGSEVGRRCAPFVYSGQWVRTIEEMDTLIDQEIRRVKDLPGKASPWVTGQRSIKDGIFMADCASQIKGVGKKLLKQFHTFGIYTVQDLAAMHEDAMASFSVQTNGISFNFMQKLQELPKQANSGEYTPRLVDHKLADNPYESRFGANWKDNAMKSSGLRSHVCVTTMVEHIVNASSAVMAGTKHADDWVFLHDALSQMTCKSTIAWMKTMGYHRRWVLPELDLNANTRYAGRPVGNSPELMPWDCSLNKDVDDCFHRHRIATMGLPRDSPLKFCGSTPRRLESAYLRILSPSNGDDNGCPTSQRIIQDITKCLTTNVLAVIDARGAVVPGLGNRNGRRRLAGVDGRGGRREKMDRAHGVWFHPDAQLQRMAMVDASIAKLHAHSWAGESIVL